MDTPKKKIQLKPGTIEDVPVILEMILELAQYEHLRNTVSATAEQLRETLFGPQPAAEVMLAYMGAECAGFALFFSTYSTFLAKRGLYLEDLFVKPHARRQGVGSALLSRIAQIAVERQCGRFEWAVLDWNEPAVRFYKKIGALPMDEWTVYRITGDALAALADQAR